MGAKRHPAERHVFALCGFDPVEHHDPFRHAMQWRKSFILEQAGELKSVAESERPSDRLCRANRPLGEEYRFDDGARTKSHPWTGGADGHEYAFEHRWSRGPTGPMMRAIGTARNQGSPAPLSSGNRDVRRVEKSEVAMCCDRRALSKRPVKLLLMCLVLSFSPSSIVAVVRLDLWRA